MEISTPQAVQIRNSLLRAHHDGKLKNKIYLSLTELIHNSQGKNIILDRQLIEVAKEFAPEIISEEVKCQTSVN